MAPGVQVSNQELFLLFLQRDPSYAWPLSVWESPEISSLHWYPLAMSGGNPSKMTWQYLTFYVKTMIHPGIEWWGIPLQWCRFPVPVTGAHSSREGGQGNQQAEACPAARCGLTKGSMKHLLWILWFSLSQVWRYKIIYMYIINNIEISKSCFLWVEMGRVGGQSVSYILYRRQWYDNSPAST